MIPRAVTERALDRVRRKLRARQRHTHLNLEVPGWGDDLIARVEVVDDEAELLISQWSLDAGVEASADLIARIVTGLSARSAAAGLEPLVDPETGDQLRFNARFGAVVEQPHCATPRAAVLLAFSVGSPATIDTLALGAFMTRIKQWATTMGADAAALSVAG